MILEIIFTLLIVGVGCGLTYYLLARKINSISTTTLTSLSALTTQLNSLANYISTTYVTSEQYVPLYNNFYGLQKQVNELQTVQGEEITSLQKITQRIQNGTAPLQSIYFK